jgi:HEAT repeat protein
MKQAENKIVTKCALFLMLAFILASTTEAQIASERRINFKKNAIANLIEGIKSENEGVRRSAIYFAGKFFGDAELFVSFFGAAGNV